MYWYMMAYFNPPIIGCQPSSEIRVTKSWIDGSTMYSMLQVRIETDSRPNSEPDSHPLDLSQSHTMMGVPLPSEGWATIKGIGTKSSICVFVSMVTDLHDNLHLMRSAAQ
jgi:hypothetical protein